MVKSLLVGYGNSLRSDDRIGLEVAQIVADWNLPEVRSLGLPQLTPELAAELALVDLAIFVDAYTANIGDRVKVLALEPSNALNFRSHFSDPRGLISLTKVIFGRSPLTWWVLVPGIDFKLGTDVTFTAQQGIEQATNKIKNLLNIDSIKDRCTKSALCKIL